MRKNYFYLMVNLLTIGVFAQVGIGTTTPSATLDVVSSGNTNSTKALEISNSSATEMVTVLNNGNVGIGTNTPTARLDIRTNPTSTTDPDIGMLGIGTTTMTAPSAGAGAIRYSTSTGGVLQYSNGIVWSTLASQPTKSIVNGNFDAITAANNTSPYLNATETFDANNDFNSNAFTVPRTGNYLFSAVVIGQITTIGNGQFELFVDVNNGTLACNAIQLTVTNMQKQAANLACSLRLNAGDIVRFRIGNNSGAIFTLSTFAYQRLFSIVEL
ncbi:MAG: hypothetical protein QM535_14675 [Limnohabitans sp.]|nr:hypothetical protein [Limnohabitans sp.]